MGLHERFHLRDECCPAVVRDYCIAEGDLAFVGPLALHALARRGLGGIVARHDALQADGFGGIDHEPKVGAAIEAGLEEDGGLHRTDGCGE